LIRNDPTSTEKNILTVRQLNEAISDAVRVAFPATVWVRGEVQRLPQDAARRQHVYFELHETGQSGAAEYQIPVSLMGWDRQRHGLGRYLDGSDPDFQLANKLEVCLECQVDFYAKFGKLSLKIVGVDKSFALGKLEAKRRAILEYLRANDLIELNKSVPLTELPLRVGLITAPGSAAERDFMTGLEASPYGFAVTLQGAKMQGEQLQAQVMAALQKLAAQPLDVVVITRGGGSRADLSWFDQKDLAEAIARCPVPVITAIGHEIDQSIADLVAHHSCKTPTAVAEFLVERLDEAAGLVDEMRKRLLAVTEDILAEANRRIDLQPALLRAARSALNQSGRRFQILAGRLQNLVTGHVQGRARRLAGLEKALAARALRRSFAARGRLDRQGMRLASLSRSRLDRARDRLAGASAALPRQVMRPVAACRLRLDHLGKQVQWLDPARLLARGYTLTLDDKGQAVTSAAGLRPGDRLLTRFVDGQVASVVHEPAGKSVGKKTRPGKKPGRKSVGKPGGADPDPTLF
jgi:exodeoxyribonuclease VII large subunit